MIHWHNARRPDVWSTKTTSKLASLFATYNSIEVSLTTLQNPIFPFYPPIFHVRMVLSVHPHITFFYNVHYRLRSVRKALAKRFAVKVKNLIITSLVFCLHNLLVLLILNISLRRLPQQVYDFTRAKLALMLFPQLSFADIFLLDYQMTSEHL